MKNDVEKEVNSLLVSKEAKDYLMLLDKLCQKTGRINSALVIRAEDGCGLTSFSRVASRIVASSIPSYLKGEEDFIELIFPKDNEKDEMLFYSSPRRATRIRNRFYGTMVISLREFDGMDLLRSNSFRRLMDFVDENKENIFLIFHVLPSFKAYGDFISTLQKSMSVKEISLNQPGKEAGYSYVVYELMDRGLSIEASATDALKDKLVRMLVENDGYQGYKSLDVLVDRVTFEATFMENSVGEKTTVDNRIVEKLCSDYEKDKNLCSEKSRFGFTV